MSNSILISTKQALGVQEHQTSFDSEILMHINSAIATLTQLGVGPETGLTVLTAEETWEDLIGTDSRLNPAKTYVHHKVKLAFDPPEIGFVLSSYERTIKELEFRLNVVVDSVPLSEKEIIDADN